MATRVRSDVTRAKDAARSRQWAIDNPERAKHKRHEAARRARQADMTLIEKSADGAYTNWLEWETNIRSVVAKALAAGTVERSSDHYGMSAEEYLAQPLPPYLPSSRTTRLAPRS